MLSRRTVSLSMTIRLPSCNAGSIELPVTAATRTEYTSSPIAQKITIGHSHPRARRKISRFNLATTGADIGGVGGMGMTGVGDTC